MDLEAFELVLLRRPADAPDYPDEELDRMIAAAVAETGASSPKDMGQVMKAVMAASGGRADGKRTSARVRGALGV